MRGERHNVRHGQAVAQCSDFLAGLDGVEVIYASDTALSARRIAEMNSPTIGAIAGEQAAELYGLRVLADGINNREANYTRFVAVSAEPVTVDPQVPSKTSLVLSVSNEAGALAEVLNSFRAEAIPLVKLESRPTVNNAWQEMFYMDFEGNVGDQRVQRVLEAVRRHTMYLRVLGTYPSRDLRPHRRPAPEPERVLRVTEPAAQPAVETAADSPYRLAGRRGAVGRRRFGRGDSARGDEAVGDHPDRLRGVELQPRVHVGEERLVVREERQRPGEVDRAGLRAVRLRACQNVRRNTEGTRQVVRAGICTRRVKTIER